MLISVNSDKERSLQCLSRQSDNKTRIIVAHWQMEVTLKASSTAPACPPLLSLILLPLKMLLV